MSGPAAGGGAPFLAIDTATTRATIALGTLGGLVLAADAWEAGHRHSEELMGRIAALLDRAGLGRPAPGALAGVVAGTGPGGFTGLRVGLATAHGLARATASPLVGVSTAASLEAAARVAGVVTDAATVAVLLPAGAAGRYVVRDGSAVLAPVQDAGADPAEGAVVVAVDLAGRAPDDACARGDAALAGLAGALVGLGAARLRSGIGPGSLVEPQYVTVPRGAAPAASAAGAEEEVAWSHVRR